MGRVSKRTSAPVVAVKEAKICYKAGIYARLSSDQDKKKNESVEVQVKIAEKYIEDFNREGTERIEIVDRYVDLGKTIIDKSKGLLEDKKKAFDIINGLDDNMHRIVLIELYFNSEPWKSIDILLVRSEKRTH